LVRSARTGSDDPRASFGVARAIAGRSPGVPVQDFVVGAAVSNLRSLVGPMPTRLRQKRSERLNVGCVVFRP